MKFAKTKLLLCLFYNEQTNQKISLSTCYHSLVTVSSVPPIFRSFPSPLISLHPLVLLSRSLKINISMHHGPSHLLSLRLLQISEFALLLFFLNSPLFYPMQSNHSDPKKHLSDCITLLSVLQWHFICPQGKAHHLPWLYAYTQSSFLSMNSQLILLSS